MFIEKKRKGVSPRLFASDGTSDGIITLSDLSDLFVKQQVVINSSTQGSIELEIKRFISDTQIRVGPRGHINAKIDLSNYLTIDGATISAGEQDRPGIKPDEINRAIYAEEPIVAKRVILVDKLGRYYDDGNPLPIDATFNGQLNVDLDGFDPASPDSALIVGSEDGTKTGVKHAARVDSALDLRVGISDGSNKAAINNDRELSVVDSAVRTTLSDILTTLASGTIAVSGPLTNAELRAAPIEVTGNLVATLGDEPIKISGTENGQPNGPEFPFVNNVLQQILKAKDREGTIEYADFGTKNQRIVRITYTAPSIGSGLGFTAVKEFSYTLVGTKYRRDTPGNWSIV